jgi:uncharacterized paraquat-inducible protein A
MNLTDLDVKAILEGHWHTLFSNEDIEAVASERLLICQGCEFFGETKCLKCGCPLRAKTRSMRSKCPVDKWGAQIIYKK